MRISPSISYKSSLFYSGPTCETLNLEFHKESVDDSQMDSRLLCLLNSPKTTREFPNTQNRTTKPAELDCNENCDHSKEYSNDAGNTNEHEYNNDTFQCKQCKKKFLYKYLYEAHLRSAHQEHIKRPYGCDHCHKRYKRINNLRYHLHKVHNSNGQTFICINCNKSYKNVASLKQHHRDQHLGQKRRKTCICEYCGAGFIGINNLENHYVAKHGELHDFQQEHYARNVSELQFNNVTDHQYHSLRQNENEKMPQYDCSFCGIKFVKKYMLLAHMRTHARNKEKYGCDQCGRNFTQKYDVVQHIRLVHMKVKPHNCDYCNQSFGTEKTLRHHIYTHTGEKPYFCKICHRNFRQPSALQTHVKCRHCE